MAVSVCVDVELGGGRRRVGRVDRRATGQPRVDPRFARVLFVGLLGEADGGWHGRGSMVRGGLVLAVGVHKIVGVAVVGSLEAELAEENMRVGQKECQSREGSVERHTHAMLGPRKARARNGCKL